jgi:hypothetical protein
MSEMSMSSASLPAMPPDTYYGQVQGSDVFTPAVGMQVEAWIGSALCGQGTVKEYAGDLVYVVHVEADDGSAPGAGCGQPGRTILFYVGGQAMAPTAAWNNSQLDELMLMPRDSYDLYLPIVFRQW